MSFAEAAAVTYLLRAFLSIFFATVTYLISGDVFLTAMIAGCVWFWSGGVIRSDRREPPEGP